jgi:M6 family metalloprotease-like protein
LHPSIRLVAAAALFLLSAPARAQDSASTITGTLGLLWADPRPGTGTPRRGFTLTDDSGRTHELALSEELLRQHGGATALIGHRVELQVSGMKEPRLTALAIVRDRGRVAGAGLARTSAGFRLSAPQSRPFAVILCRFSDSPQVTPATKAHYERYVPGNTFPSVSDYWREVSAGQLDLTGSAVYGWYDLPQPRSYYVSAGGSPHLAHLAQDCASVADADVDFPAFAGVAFQFNKDLGCCSIAADITLDRDGQQKGYLAVWMADWATGGVGSYAHEIGHTFGLQHTSGPYGATYDSQWDVMSWSAWWGVADVGMGAHTLAIQKDRLGLIPASRKVQVIGTDERTLLVERSALPGANANPLLVTVPIPGGTTSGQHYYTIEARRRVGYDAGLVGDGVVIHRSGDNSATRVVDVDGNGDPNDAGALWTVGETFRDRESGVTVRIDGEEGSAFRVAVRGAAPLQSIAIAPASRRRTIAFGTGVARADSALLTVSGASPQPWYLLRYGRRIQLATTSGTGSATIRWTEQQAGLGAGMHVDTVVVVADGALGSPLRIIDTLEVNAPAALALALDGTSQGDSLMPGGSSYHVATAQPSGPGADALTWTATARAPWIVFEQATGTGEGTFSWSHDAAQLAPGIYVDTIVVSASGVANPALLVDTLRVLTPPTMTLARTSGSRHMLQSSRAVVDSIRLELTGPDAAGLRWNTGVASPGERYLYPQYAPVPNVGSGWVRLRWDPGSLAPGMYVSRAGVAPVLGGSARAAYVDTLYVDPAPSTIALSATSRRDSVVASSFGSIDSVWVQPQGEGGPQREWGASANALKTNFLARGSQPVATAFGPTWLVWTRNTADREPGVYVDTITVRLVDGSGISTRLIDSLIVLAPPALMVEATSRSTRTTAGSGVPSADSSGVAVGGYGVSNFAWSATHRGDAPWLTLTTSSGNGVGMLRWTRSAAQLAVGVYVDTIVVVAPGVPGATRRILDSLRVVPALAIVSDPIRRAGTMGVPYADTLRAEGGAAEPRWSIVAGALPDGVKLDSISGALAGEASAVGSFHFTARARSDASSVQRDFTIAIAAPVLTATAVLDHLLSAGNLSATDLRYLDLLGNRNGRLDVGDVRAWLATAAPAGADGLRAVVEPDAMPSTKGDS